LCRRLGVTRIRAVSDERHSLQSDYARGASPVSAQARRLSYNETWRERGGEQVSAAFFELPVATRRRAEGEIPAKKRKLYASRYLLLNLWEARLEVAMRSLTPLAARVAPARPRRAEPVAVAAPAWRPTRPAAEAKAAALAHA
jgi:hypothetical protein